MLKSFLKVAERSHFPIKNIPFSAGHKISSKKPVCVSRIGDYIIDLKYLELKGYFKGLYSGKVFNGPTLNKFMEKDKKV